LVQIIPETPLKYKAVPFDRFIERRVGQLKEEAEDLERSRVKLAEAFQVKTHEPDEQGKFEMFYVRRNVRDKLRDMYSSAKKNVISIGNQRSPMRIIRTSISIIEDIAEEGVKIEYAFPVTDENMEKVERLNKYATIKHIDRVPSMHFIIVDGKECMLVHRIPDDEDPVRGEDIAIWSNDNAIVTTMEEFAKDVFDSGLQHTSYNLIRPSLTQITNWIRSLDIDYKLFLKQLGENLGIELAKKCKAKKLEPLMKEIKAFWKEHNLGNFDITKKKPFTIAMEYNMSCQSNPDLAYAICDFVRSLIGTIIKIRTGMDSKIKAVDCKPDFQTFCKFEIDVKK
jgi:sugar-specific transcriptional regulator TrmB